MLLGYKPYYANVYVIVTVDQPISHANNSSPGYLWCSVLSSFRCLACGFSNHFNGLNQGQKENQVLIDFLLSPAQCNPHNPF